MTQNRAPLPRAERPAGWSSLRPAGRPEDCDVLVACEYSGRVRDAFRALGFNAVSCDLLPSEQPGPHIQGDVRDLLNQEWDLVIAHPPCTYLANSGVRWRVERQEWAEIAEAAAFFTDCLKANAASVAVENPVMHRYAREAVGGGADFTVQPWQFGDPFKKRTCFWTFNLPPLVPTSDLTAADAEAACHRAPPSPDRWKDRSRTYPGIAKAMAEQWGGYLLGQTPDPTACRIAPAGSSSWPAAPAPAGRAPVGGLSGGG